MSEPPADPPESLSWLLRARCHGATAVTGRLDPPLLPAISRRRCFLHRGDAFLTHLEGEWWA